MNEIKIGTYTGTGAAINNSIGFKPDYVRVFNLTDGDEAFNYFAGVTAGISNVKEAAALATQAANGISAYEGSSTPGSEASPGFTAGTAASENGKLYGYIAMRSGPGAN